MLSTQWSRRLQNFLGSPPKTRQRRPARLRLEELENRCVPAAFSFTTGNTDLKMAVLTQPEATGKAEHEAGDDFVLSTETALSSATFDGLVPLNSLASNINEVVVEIYRVFPLDSNTTRTIKVPTRTNSPSDVDFESRDSAANQLSFTTTVLANSATALNSVVNGIHPAPNQTTGGDGPATGEEVRFNVTLSHPLILPAGHYFFVPQVGLNTGDFLWLSAPKPTTPPFTGDLQSWTRDSSLEPDWLRVGTDIIGGTTPPTFNQAFSIAGNTVSPRISSLSPTHAPEGSRSIIVTVNGSNFTESSVVDFNGAPLATKFVSDSKLQVTLSSALLETAVKARIVVTEPTAANSNAAIFAVENVKPHVTAHVTRIQQVHGHTIVTVTGSFTDAGRETHKIVVNWGDGTITRSNRSATTSGKFIFTHNFKKLPRDVSVQVTDQFGGASNLALIGLSRL